ncbi:MAG: hypothetical protein JNL60_00800 [Bacteroidia bacterium]|nr:hypothetical protein [Bacteroidia bacterium]
MLRSAKITLAESRNSILKYGFIACLFYIAFLLLMRVLNLHTITELRMVNYVFLCVLCIVEIKRQVTKGKGYVPFLEVFFESFFTGVVSFLLFSVFLFFYTRFDEEMNEIILSRASETLKQIPTAIILFEGAAVSIVVALINLQYFRRYEEGEVPVDK